MSKNYYPQVSLEDHVNTLPKKKKWLDILLRPRIFLWFIWKLWRIIFLISSLNYTLSDAIFIFWATWHDLPEIFTLRKNVLTSGKKFSHQAENFCNKGNILTPVEKFSQQYKNSHGSRKILTMIKDIKNSGRKKVKK